MWSRIHPNQVLLLQITLIEIPLPTLRPPELWADVKPQATYHCCMAQSQTYETPLRRLHQL